MLTRDTSRAFDRLNKALLSVRSDLVTLQRAIAKQPAGAIAGRGVGARKHRPRARRAAAKAGGSASS